MRNKYNEISSALILAVCLVSATSGQNGPPISRVERGTTIVVRTADNIAASRIDNRVYGGTVDQDVRAGDGRIAIPRGSSVELIVRAARDNSLMLDLESVTAGGQRYAVSTDANLAPTTSGENPLVGAIIGAVTGGQASGRSVKVRRGSVLTFRLERPLEVGIADRGETRGGKHYHEYYRPR